MIITTLTALWRMMADSQRHPVDKMHFVTFAVDNPDVAQELRSWMEADRIAQDARQAFLDTVVPPYFRAVQMEYKTDLDGRLTMIAFCGSYMPHGWTQAIADSTWLKPEAPEVVAAVRGLPQSSRRALHDLIGWPTIEKSFIPQGQHEAVHLANALVRPEEQGGRVYIRVPHPDNFKTLCPVIYNTFYDWSPPEGIRKVMPVSRPSSRFEA
ncbi:MAG: hypothetical protein HYU57_03910 [Micavibrio aeruginosavorus]|nr:hypothetical protein [Micavibrio aeruginosavorus]